MVAAVAVGMPDFNGGPRQRLRGIEALVISHLPEWRSRAEEIRRSCLAVVKANQLTDRDQAETEGEMLFSIVATSDQRALPFLDLAAHDPSGAVDFLGKLHELTVALRAMEKDAQAASRNVA